ncbi:MAG: PAS domain S-box protein [Myxococcales bacterium]|nr:PAS domain S-box protein [Myxococcales bacterium]
MFAGMLTRDRAAFRAAALFLTRHRAAIEAEVDRRLGRAEPPPAARAEIVRRFRSFCRLASLDLSSARPSLDGLAGTSPEGLERAISTAVQVARSCGPAPDIEQALQSLGARFRGGIRQLMRPSESPVRKRGRRKLPNAGRRVRAAIDRINDAYVALNLDTGRIYDLNPAAETLFAADAAKLLDREFEELVEPALLPQYQSLQARLDAGEDPGRTEMVFARTNGERVPVVLTISNHTIGGRRIAIFVARERDEEPPGYSTLST